MKDRNDSKVIELKTALGDSNNPHNSKFGNYKPDDELLQSTTRIKNQRDVIGERIQKMEVASSRVSGSVFEKVKRDYALQLQTITELLDEKKASLKKEIKDLYIRREKLTVEINRHKEILEEAEFRHYLGEFSQSQFQEVQNYESKEIEKLENDLARISQYIRTHEELFDPQDLGITPKPAPTPAPAGEVTKTAHVAAPQPVATQAPVTPEPQLAAPVAQPAAPTPQPATPTPQPTAPAAAAQTPVSQPDALIEPTISHEADVAPIVDQSEASQPPVEPAAASVVADDNDFESLFDDDNAEESAQAKLVQSQTNIKELIDDQGDDDSVSDIIPKPESDDDYFNQEQVNESSFTVKKANIDDLEMNEDTPKPQKLEESDKSDVKTDVRVPMEESAKVSDDSISDILDSINLDDSKPKTAAEPKNDIPLDLEVSDASNYVLTLIEGELDLKELQLKDNISIGRSSANDLVLKAPKVSRQHAAINMYNNQFIIIDLKSSNGVYVNGAKIDECVLNLGDEVSVGGYRFKFELKS